MKARCSGNDDGTTYRKHNRVFKYVTKLHFSVGMVWPSKVNEFQRPCMINDFWNIHCIFCPYLLLLDATNFFSRAIGNRKFSFSILRLADPGLFCKPWVVRVLSCYVALPGFWGLPNRYTGIEGNFAFVKFVSQCFSCRDFRRRRGTNLESKKTQNYKDSLYIPLIPQLPFCYLFHYLQTNLPLI